MAGDSFLNLKDKVQAEALVRQSGDFCRFLEVISFARGSLLILASLAREAEIPRKRAWSCFGTLQGLALEGLEAVHTSALCQLRADSTTLIFRRTRSVLEGNSVVLIEPLSNH